MTNFTGALLLMVMCVVCVQVGLHFGHSNHALIALVPIGAFCAVCGGFLLARGGKR